MTYTRPKGQPLERLETAAVQIVSRIRELNNPRILGVAIIGGLAVKKYHWRRGCSNVDLFILVEEVSPEVRSSSLEIKDSSPEIGDMSLQLGEWLPQLEVPRTDIKKTSCQGITSKLLHANPHVFDLPAQKLLYKTPDDNNCPKHAKARRERQCYQQANEVSWVEEQEQKSIQIDMITHFFCPYIPEGVRRIQDLTDGVIPYISIGDLVVFKVWSAGLRHTMDQRKLDKEDAQELLSNRKTDLTLSETQRRAVEEGLDDLLSLEPYTYDAAWWRGRLGLPL